MSMDDSWVFDSLVCFLHGPIWNAPLQTFIEEKSLVFDPNLLADEESADVQAIYEEYKNLVDFMLGSFMEEMQITVEQFESACMEGRNQHKDNPFQFHQGLFQQIWAANDIKIFIRMMTQRNVELQLQALDLIEKNQLALLHESDSFDGSHAAADNSIDSPHVENVDDLVAKSLEHDLSDTPEAALTPEHDEVTDKFARLNLFFEKNRVNPDDMITRQEYLRQQRDKIVEIKKKTRAKQLQDTLQRKSGGQPNANGRPSSAQVAQRLLENGGNTGELLEHAQDGGGGDEALQLRKTLAKRLRTEVVEQQ